MTYETLVLIHYHTKFYSFHPAAARLLDAVASGKVERVIPALEAAMRDCPMRGHWINAMQYAHRELSAQRKVAACN